MMKPANKPGSGDLQTALENAAALLAHDPQLAEKQVFEILKVQPDSFKAKRILASAFRLERLLPSDPQLYGATTAGATAYQRTC